MKKNTFTILFISLFCVSIAAGFFGYKFLCVDEDEYFEDEFFVGEYLGDNTVVEEKPSKAKEEKVKEDKVKEAKVKEPKVKKDKVKEPKVKEPEIAEAQSVAKEQPKTKKTKRNKKAKKNEEITSTQEPQVATANSDVPRITWVDEPKQLAREIAEGVVEYHFQAAAKTNEKVALEYKMKSKDTGREYTNRSGKFKIEPTDSGEYTLTVKNTVTDEISNPKVIKGFKKVGKLYSSELQVILNDVSTPDNNKMIYANFVKQSDLVIVVNGLQEGEIPPASLSAIWAAVTAQGWNVVVLGNPEYDKYNRIKKFSINIEQ